MNRINFLNKNDGLNQVVTIKNKLLYKNNVNELDNKVKVEPLSYSQQQIWIIDQMQSGNYAYNLPIGFRLRGRLNVEIIEKSFNAIIKRHETLRTTFGLIENQPRQIVYPECIIKVKQIDLSNYPIYERENRLAISVREEVIRSFNLTELPLIRVSIFRLSGDENILLVNIHHIVTDGWSTALIFNELSELYNSQLNNLDSKLEDLPIQYSDYAKWQLQKNWNPPYDEQLNFWKKQFYGELPHLELPSSKQRPTIQSLNGSNKFFFLPNDLIQKIQSVGIKRGCSFFMTVLAVFQVFLSKYTGIDDIIIGTPISNRSRKEDESLIGNFLNIVALRNDLSYNSDFVSLLQSTQKITLEALKNRDLPFEKIVDQLRIQRDLSRNPVFQVMLQVLPKYSFDLSNLTIDNYNFDLCYSQFDLSLHLYQLENGYNCRFEYDTDLFDNSFIDRMVSNFKKLINGIIEDPLKKLNEYSIISDEENKILSSWNETDTFYSENKCYFQLFEEQVEKRYDQIAVKYADNYLTYGELNNRANKLANYLIKKGIKKGSVVGILIDRSINMLIGLLSIVKAGAAYVPLDPSFPKERLQYIVKDSRINVLLTEGKLDELISVFNVSFVFIDSEWEIIKKEDDKNLNLNQSPSDLIYIIYTSGSTGNPKGVMIEHRAITNFLQSMQKEPGFNENDNLLAVTTMSFDISGLEFYLPLISGGCVVIADKSETIDGKALLNIIKKKNITVMQATPSTWKIMLDTGWEKTQKLKILCGGEAFSKDMAGKLLEKCDEFWNMYGPTETTIWSSVRKIEKNDAKILIGRPIANTQFYAVDNDLNPVPIGVAGELLIGGKGLARGYLNREELTREKFIKNLNIINNGILYRTGDLVKYNIEGNIEFLGRNDFQVKIRGFRIELGEIEARLIEYDDIKEAVVVVNENQIDDKKLVAYLILQKTNELEIQSLINHLKERVPDYMIPSYFIEMNEFPLTPNGKVDRKALPAPNENIIFKDKSNETPQLELEKEVAAVWKVLLELGQISNSDNFFAIGGTSLLAITLIYQLNDKFKIDLPLSIIFDAPTISKLSTEIEKVKILAYKQG